MPEGISPVNNIDWKRVNKTPYRTRLGEINTESNDAVVYLRNDLPFVLKTYLNPSSIAAQMETAQALEGLVPAMAAYHDVLIRVNNRIVRLADCLAQERLSALTFSMSGKAKPKDLDKYIDLVEKKVGVDNQIAERQLYVPDPKLHNYGKTSKDEVKLLDLGGLVRDPFADEQYFEMMLIRGAGHYFNYLSLQTMFDTRTLQSTKEGLEIAGKYQEFTGLDFDSSIRAASFLGTSGSLNGLIPNFGSRFIALTLEEMNKFRWISVPTRSILESAVNAQPQDWHVYPNGSVGLFVN